MKFVRWLNIIVLFTFLSACGSGGIAVPGFPTAHHSFTLDRGELSRTVNPVRFGTYAGVDSPVGAGGALKLLASEVGRDAESRMRELAYSIQRGDE